MEKIFPYLVKVGLKNINHYILCLLRGRCSSKVVKINVKPLINFLLDSIVLGTQFLRCDAFLHCLKARLIVICKGNS